MTTPRPPRSVDPIDGRSLVETAVVAIGTTFLLLGATIAAFVAAGAVGDGPLTVVVSLTAGIGTIGAGVVAARLVDRWLGKRLDRRPCSAAPARSC